MESQADSNLVARAVLQQQPRHRRVPPPCAPTRITGAAGQDTLEYFIWFYLRKEYVLWRIQNKYCVIETLK